MTIDTALLVSANVLQDYLVDKTGSPLAAGTITCFQDTSRTTLKNWYMQSGTPGAYTYVPLPNPLTLSAAGTICDASGNDVVPFFYPYDESNANTPQPYYITVVDMNNIPQFTRSNFPFVPEEGGSLVSSTSEENYIINNVFWKNIGLGPTPISGTNMQVAPSQHYGFQYPNIRFIKDIGGSTESVSFPQFPLGNQQSLNDDITPEYYLRHQCTVAVGGEGLKCYRFPISLHLLTLSSVTTAIVTIQAKNTGGGTGTASQMSLAIYQDTGTGGAPSAPVTTAIPDSTFSAGSNWQKWSFPVKMPGTTGLSLGTDGNDAVYLQVMLPLSQTFDLSFTKPSFYLAEQAPVNSFQTYDQIDAIINNPTFTSSPALLNVQKFTSGSGTYTPTTGTGSILVQCIGAGGGGGGTASSASTLRTGADGGAGGGFAQKLYATLPSTRTYSVGAAGAGGVGNTTGGAGGATTFSTDMNVTGGAGGAGKNASSSTFMGNCSLGGAAGSGDASDVVYSGAPGFYGQAYVDASLAFQGWASGSGGAGGNGNGGAPGAANANGNGANAVGFGGGGAGAISGATTSPNTGGSGASGCILIYEYASAFTAFSQ